VGSPNPGTPKKTKNPPQPRAQKKPKKKKKKKRSFFFEKTSLRDQSLSQKGEKKPYIRIEREERIRQTHGGIERLFPGRTRHRYCRGESCLSQRPLQVISLSLRGGKPLVGTRQKPLFYWGAAKAILTAVRLLFQGRFVIKFGGGWSQKEKKERTKIRRKMPGEKEHRRASRGTLTHYSRGDIVSSRHKEYLHFFESAVQLAGKCRFTQIRSALGGGEKKGRWREQMAAYTGNNGAENPILTFSKVAAAAGRRRRRKRGV